MTPIPTWAAQRACDLANAECSSLNYWSAGDLDPSRSPPGRSALIALARYIAEHEEAPVDPLLQIARELAAEHGSSRHTREEILGGMCDEHRAVQTILTALRRGIEIGGGHG